MHWEDSQQVQEWNGVDVDVALSVLPKANEVAYEVPSVVEDFIEPKLGDCSLNMPCKLSLVQDVQVCVVVVPEQVLELPKEGKDDLGQLVDPFGFVFKQASFNHSVETFQHAKVDSSWCNLRVCIVRYYEDILIHKRHGKLVISLHKSMDAVDVHKRKLILKMGYCLRVTWIKEMQPHAILWSCIINSSIVLCFLISCLGVYDAVALRVLMSF
ncbi:uncharacterized protein LOC131325283 [Rhododendron vialii]|uniref:uncharacterized protein LOC131325283 n=1 Tax=Rhododendron vialii TaxID=182163 RepID=UPI00265D87F6|nr:uncharacterized protein LOC131325283 [Rhododendron vialii]